MAYDPCLGEVPAGLCLPEGLEMTWSRLQSNATVTLIAMAVFFACFWLAHDKPFGVPGFGLLQRMYPKHYATWDDGLRADMASRLHCTVHAFLMLLHFSAFSECGIWFKPLANTCASSEVIFSITVGYFAFDLFVVLIYRMKFWQVFVVHHTLAIAPYFINNFLPNCGAGHYVLGFFVQVELAVPTLNYQNLLEATGRKHTPLYKAVFCAGYGIWFVFRILLPLYVCSLTLNHLYPYYGWQPQAALSYFTAAFVLVFCSYVFALLLTPELLLIVRGEGKPVEKTE